MKSSPGKIIGILMSVMFIALTGCAPSDLEIPITGDQTPTPASTPDREAVLANTYWHMVSYGPSGTQQQVIDGTDITLEFDDQGNATGNSGCNVFGGDYQVSSDYQISITNIVSTERACVDEDLMEQERKYYDALNSANLFELTDDSLLIWYEDGRNVLRFEKSDGTTSVTETEVP